MKNISNDWSTNNIELMINSFNDISHRTFDTQTMDLLDDILWTPLNASLRMSFTPIFWFDHYQLFNELSYDRYVF